MPDLLVHIPGYLARTPERAAEWLRRRLPIGTDAHPDYNVTISPVPEPRRPGSVGTCAEGERPDA